MKYRAASALVACMLMLNPTAAALAQRLFYSGHSLLDAPLPRDVAAIAASLGMPLQWQQHTPYGSSMRDRAALAIGAGFDTLLVTEQHTLIGNLVWNDSVGELRRARERFVAANPRGRVWFYASWLNVDDLADPRRWVAYERAASSVWHCVVVRANASLPADGRIEFLPAAALLAAAAEQAALGRLPGVTVRALFSDDVHLSPLGSYFMSLVVFATLFERSPVGAGVPEGLDAATSMALQNAAWQLVQQERAQRETLSPGNCGERTRRFVAPYAAYVRDIVDRPQVGLWRAWWRWAKHHLQWHWALRNVG